MDQIKVGAAITFADDSEPYTVRAMSERFAICTYPVVHEGQNTVMYSIIDNETMMRGPNNLVLNPYDYATDEGCEESLADLESGTVELSRRYSIPLLIHRIDNQESEAPHA